MKYRIELKVGETGWLAEDLDHGATGAGKSPEEAVSDLLFQIGVQVTEDRSDRRDIHKRRAMYHWLAEIMWAATMMKENQRCIHQQVLRSGDGDLEAILKLIEAQTGHEDEFSRACQALAREAIRAGLTPEYFQASGATIRAGALP